MAEEITTEVEGTDDGDNHGESVSKAEARKSSRKISKRESRDVVAIMFRGSRTFELHAGRELYHFGPHEKKEVPRSVLDTDGFKQAARYFTITE